MSAAQSSSRPSRLTPVRSTFPSSASTPPHPFVLVLVLVLVEEPPPDALSSLSLAGVVMSVRWNNAGSYLASGSDDRVVMIWAHEGCVLSLSSPRRRSALSARSRSRFLFPPRSGGGGKVWGTDTTNVENWKAVRRLVGHNSGPSPLLLSCSSEPRTAADPAALPLADVAGVAWSPDDAYCASVGLDNVVLVWSGQTFGAFAPSSRSPLTAQPSLTPSLRSQTSFASSMATRASSRASSSTPSGSILRPRPTTTRSRCGAPTTGACTPTSASRSTTRPRRP